MVQVTFKTKMTSIELALWRWLVQTWGCFFLLRASSSMHYEYIYMVHVTFKKWPLYIWSLVHAPVTLKKKIDLYWASSREVSPCTMNTHAWFTSPSGNNSLYRASSMKAISTAQGLIFSWLHGASSSEVISAEVVIFSSMELAPRTIHMHGSCQFQEKYHTSKYIAWFRAVYL